MCTLLSSMINIDWVVAVQIRASWDSVRISCPDRPRVVGRIQSEVV